jgi:acyl-ACP thioesterase
VVDSELEDDGIWIVRRLVIHVPRAPRFDEALDVATFCSGAARMWAERRTTIRGEAGGHVETVALWVHLSADGARPRPLPDGFDAVYGAAAAGRRVKARLSHPADPPDGAAERSWTFRYADLDMAAHVNNAAYWAVLEQELAGAELPPGWHAEIEHRGPAPAGPAEVHRADGLHWIVSDGAVVASLRAAIG